VKNSKYPLICGRNVCLANGNTGVISMCCQLSLRFVLVSLYLRWYSVLSVSVTYFYRSASLKATKRFPGVDLFLDRVSSRYEKNFVGGYPPREKKKKVWEHWSALWSSTHPDFGFRCLISLFTFNGSFTDTSKYVTVKSIHIRTLCDVYFSCLAIVLQYAPRNTHMNTTAVIK